MPTTRFVSSMLVVRQPHPKQGRPRKTLERTHELLVTNMPAAHAVIQHHHEQQSMQSMSHVSAAWLRLMQHHHQQPSLLCTCTATSPHAPMSGSHTPAAGQVSVAVWGPMRDHDVNQRACGKHP